MHATYMDEEDQYLVKVAEVGPCLHVEAKLLLKVTTKANLHGRREEGRREKRGIRGRRRRRKQKWGEEGGKERGRKKRKEIHNYVVSTKLSWTKKYS